VDFWLKLQLFSLMPGLAGFPESGIKNLEIGYSNPSIAAFIAAEVLLVAFNLVITLLI